MEPRIMKVVLISDMAYWYLYEGEFECLVVMWGW